MKPHLCVSVLMPLKKDYMWNEMWNEIKGTLDKVMWHVTQRIGGSQVTSSDVPDWHSQHGARRRLRWADDCSMRWCVLHTKVSAISLICQGDQFERFIAQWIFSLFDCMNEIEHLKSVPADHRRKQWTNSGLNHHICRTKPIKEDNHSAIDFFVFVFF